MSATSQAPTTTRREALDAAAGRLKEAARLFAERPIGARVALARAMLAGAGRLAERMVAEACASKGIAPGTPPAGEEWLASPYTTHRILRQTVSSLVALERSGNTRIGRVRRMADGQLAVQVFPADRLDALVFAGLSGEVHLTPGGDEDLHEPERASFYRGRHHEGRVCLVLGAGNVNSIPAADVVAKLFNEGKVCLLKMNPVNAYLGPLLEEAFAEAIAGGVLAIVYGGAEEGSYLAHHPAVDEVHITGSDRTHDLLVWGPPGPERAERMARGTPLLEKEVTSELGNVTPILVVPGPFTPRELAYQADSVAGMVTHNASFNCIAGKMLVLPRGWPHRQRFLDLVLAAMALTPPRRAWYPGAAERYERLTRGRPDVHRLGGGGEDTLPFTLVGGLRAEDPEEIAYRMEAFCPLLFATELGSADPLEFLSEATRFANERLWGTLSAALVASERTLADEVTSGAVEQAIRRLRYGSVCVNVWPGVAYSSGTGPWGAFPGAPLTDIQSGRGFVHNTLMLERVEKLVMRGPSRSLVKLPYFPSHRTAHELSRRLAYLELDGRKRRLPGIVLSALRA